MILKMQIFEKVNILSFIKMVQDFIQPEILSKTSQIVNIQEMLADFTQIWLYLLKKFLMENFICCEVTFTINLADS